jgi:transcription termination/antitermination protein NusG
MVSDGNDNLTDKAPLDQDLPVVESGSDLQECANPEELPESVDNETDEEPRILAKGDTPDFKWYIAKTMTGQENKVRRSVQERVINLKLTEFFAEIIVPEESVVTNVSGKKRTIKKKFFPGYVLVKMIMNDTTWHLVRDTDKITGFVGGNSERPTPMSESEVEYMINQVEGGGKKTRTAISFSEGETVKVTEGPFTSFVGTVESVNEKGKVKVNVSIFGRPTPVELDVSQVEKVS